MEAGARQKAQGAFTRGRARVVVATVAFGLGVDMREIRGVVHFDMPKSIENYVQEIGRAGRDGRAARCCLLLCDRDFVTHHSLAHSKGLELVQVRLYICFGWMDGSISLCRYYRCIDVAVFFFFSAVKCSP